MGHWEQSESNLQIDYAPPLKRPKTSDDDDDLQTDHLRMLQGSSNPQINPPGKIFFKTRLCAKFRMGQCRNGENCNFAHGEEDRRQPPPNWQDLVSGRPDDRNWEEDDKIIHRMKLCKKFYNGEDCPYGERCNFLHKEPPKHRDSPNPAIARFRESPRESSAISIGITGPPVVQMQQSNGFDQFGANRAVVEAGFDASRGNVKPVYWKTRMCTKWEVTGHCPFGEKCHFAHGNSELQMSGGRPSEAESVNQNYSAPKPLIPGAANQPGAARTELIMSSQEEQQRRKKCVLKWNAVHGMEYGFGAHDFPVSGVFEVEPKTCPGFIYRTSIPLGCINIPYSEFRELIENVTSDYHGDTYHLITKNCNHFTDDIASRLTGKNIPKWVNRLARAGAACSCLLPDSLQMTTIAATEYHECEEEETEHFSAAENHLVHSENGEAAHGKLHPADHC